MSGWLSRLFEGRGGRKGRSGPRGGTRGEGAPPPLSQLRPVLIPSSVFDGGVWVGPYNQFRDLPVSLTWAYLCPGNTMLYLSQKSLRTLTASRADWRKSARDALHGEFLARPWTHHFTGPSGDVEAVAMLHEDGLGPSRLMFVTELLQHFPSGFDFFVPERAAACVLSRGASEIVREKIAKVVFACHQQADVPMGTNGFRHEVLARCLESAGESP